MGDGGWISHIDWPELSVAVVSDRLIVGSVISAMAPSMVVASSTLAWQTAGTKVYERGTLWDI